MHVDCGAAVDAARVKLLPVDHGSDFINASYIPGYTTDLKEYIATQGPLPHTINDFWRMVWEQKSPIIVMLTQCVESGKRKCEKYWPSDKKPAFYGDIQVNLTSETNNTSYVQRVFRLQLREAVRNVEQYHYVDWGDHSIPESRESLLNFITTVRNAILPSRPTVVHCSAGVGRTGTFIAIDTLLQHMRDNQEVDVVHLTWQMRKCRPKMIQTEEQYILTYDCVCDALLNAGESDTEDDEPEDVRPPGVPWEGFDNYVFSLDDEGLYQEQYQSLHRMSPMYSQTEAQLGINKDKNRYIDILPFEHARVKLQVPFGNPMSDYINASFIQGHNSHEEYIAAQGPKKNTLEAFWRMLWENKVENIVMLTKCEENGKMKCEQYWQDSEQGSSFGEIKVRVVQQEDIGQHICRTFSVRKGNTTRTMKHYHFLSWPDFGCPQNTSDLVNFTKLVRENLPKSTDGPPVAVHCSAGVGRTGTFIMIDRLLQEIEGQNGMEIDIFSLILELRQNRPRMVQSLAQYKFIHECLRDIRIGKIRDDFEEPMYENV